MYGVIEGGAESFAHPRTLEVAPALSVVSAAPFVVVEKARTSPSRARPCPMAAVQENPLAPQTLGALDLKLLQALELDGRAPFNRIARVLGVSDQTVAGRRRRDPAG